MSNGPLPLQLEPRKLADRGIHFSGELPLVKFGRLAELIDNSTGAVQVKLGFGRDEQKQALMQLEISAKVVMQCQRCLDEAWFTLEESFNYLISSAAVEPDFLPDGYELLQVSDEPLDLLTMVEDELLLCLPIVPMHPEGECQFPAGFEAQQQEAGEVTGSSPFSVLAQLKRDKNP